MEPLISFQMRVILAALIVASVNLVCGQQISSPCTTSMMSSFTPCANIITGSTNNGLLPPTTCCDSLRTLMSTNMDCACLVMSANAPFFQQPLNQVLALSLSQACNINGLSVQCKASRSPSPPAPGPAVLGPNGPTFPQSAASPLSPQVSKMVVVAEVYKHENENMQLAQALALAPAPAPAPAASSPTMEAEAPTRTPAGIRPVLTPRPSASHPSYVSLSPSAFILIGIMVFGIHY